MISFSKICYLSIIFIFPSLMTLTYVVFHEEPMFIICFNHFLADRDTVNFP